MGWGVWWSSLENKQFYFEHETVGKFLFQNCLFGLSGDDGECAHIWFLIEIYDWLFVLNEQFINFHKEKENLAGDY